MGWPKKLFPRMLILIVLALVLAQAISLWVLSSAHRNVLRDSVHRYEISQFVSLVQLLEQMPTNMHAQAIGVWQGAGRRLDFVITPHLARAERGLAQRLQASIESRLGEPYYDKVRVSLTLDARRGTLKSRPPTHNRIGYSPPPANHLNHGEAIGSGKAGRPVLSQLSIAVQLDSGQWLSGSMLAPQRQSLMAIQTVIFLVSSIILVIVVVFWQLRKITQPLRQLEQGANAMGRGQIVAPLVVDGPEDVRTTLHAFNQMNDRIQRFVSDRTRMLAALSHDLRTPITTMRLRLELMDAGKLRDKLLQSLDEMQQMSESTLAFVSESGDTEASTTLDLNSLLSSLCDDLHEQGRDVTYVEPEGMYLVTGRPIALRRVFSNVIENAVTYGFTAKVSVERKEEVWVHIDDCGTGIPEEYWQNVFEPFYRLEGSRNRQTGGVGLGLSIVKQLVDGHGGRIEFFKATKGFRVSIALPTVSSPH
jgi:signal transduction histidine kinase